MNRLFRCNYIILACFIGYKTIQRRDYFRKSTALAFFRPFIWDLSHKQYILFQWLGTSWNRGKIWINRNGRILCGLYEQNRGCWKTKSRTRKRKFRRTKKSKTSILLVSKFHLRFIICQYRDKNLFDPLAKKYKSDKVIDQIESGKKNGLGKINGWSLTLFSIMTNINLHP